MQTLNAIVFDWAGTTIDHGSLAPTMVFREIFARRGIEITTAQAREPMGMAKREHIAAVGAMPEVSEAWHDKYGAPLNDSDVTAMYEEFLPLQERVLQDHCQLIDGTIEAVAKCRELGLKIGSSTGYTRHLMETVTAKAASQGYSPDCVLCAEDAPRGRPAPYLLHEAAKRLDVYPMWSIVKVDDTTAGIEAGRNAGCWTIGVTRTGNLVGLSMEEIAAASEDDIKRRCAAAESKLRRAGAHYTVDSVADIPAILKGIAQRAAAGEVPIG